MTMKIKVKVKSQKIYNFFWKWTKKARTGMTKNAFVVGNHHIICTDSEEEEEEEENGETQIDFSKYLLSKPIPITKKPDS
jgi:hypothetical protein